MSYAYTEDQLVEQPAGAQFGELGWKLVSGEVGVTALKITDSIG